jgi:hypothetical protein
MDCNVRQPRRVCKWDSLRRCFQMWILLGTEIRGQRETEHTEVTLNPCWHLCLVVYVLPLER